MCSSPSSIEPKQFAVCKCQSNPIICLNGVKNHHNPVFRISFSQKAMQEPLDVHKTAGRDM